MGWMGRGMSDESVLGGMRPHGWSPDEVAAYEVAVALLNQVVGVYAARIRDQRDDPAAVAALRAEQARYVEQRQRLRPGDRDGVARVRRECAAIIRAADQAGG